MTTIAWDGPSIAADTQMVSGGTRVLGRKLMTIKHPHPMPDAIFGWVGAWYYAETIALHLGAVAAMGRELHLSGAEEGTLVEIPKLPQGTREYGMLWSGGRMWTLDGPRLLRCPVFAAPYAMGSGAHYALGAMAQGATAEQAVRIAARYDVHTGIGWGVDVLQLTGDAKAWQGVK